ncbi:erythromycin esterase family protein [Nocardia aurantiaca]|uniref:Erythromycin esterase family protein n=1 Tax=Nocardia aurantiaca TaxID=2675850 RepID=A0A6I3KWT2_9NOCA|nr:erythromycin esterase family protein [Nocardia aurantiaca]MTE13196.1 erythromycin esterase family protein [Nocardia aurantiaca]
MPTETALSAHSFDATTPDTLAQSLSNAVIVGIGESTRFAHETFAVRDGVFRKLVEHHGFRTLAVQDSADVAETLDVYVRDGKGTADSALDLAWRPWRTAEMVAALNWIRQFNQSHPGDQVRIIGVKPAQAKPEDYDAVLDAVRAQASDRLAELVTHLEPIRTAHVLDEHVQRARGVHPGRLFLDHARDASALLASIPGVSETIRARMALIEDFHRHSVAGRGSFAGEAELWASSIIGHYQRTGLRTVYWDGISHVSAGDAAIGPAQGQGAKASVGSVLREHFGREYASVAIGFHHGNVGVAEIRAPAPDFLDAQLGALGLPKLWLDLRTDPIAGPAKMRVISGVYDPRRDADEHLAVRDLAEAFDLLVHIREVTPVQWLP